MLYSQIELFWRIISLGIAIPCTLVLLVNIYVAIKSPNHKVNRPVIGLVYFVGLVCWALFFSR